MSKELLSKEEILHNLTKRWHRTEGLDTYTIHKAMDEYAKQEGEKIFRFAEWASHADWTYLPSKGKWYNEENEENITPLTTEQLYNLYQQSKQ